jgi:hypothetical protein
MKKEIVSAYGKALLLFLLIPWLINFFVPLSIFLPLSSTIERTRPSTTQMNIMGAVLSLIVVLCYLLLGKYIQEGMRDADESPVERNDSKSVKEIYSSKKGDLLLYSLASLALPVLVYCLQNIFGVTEGPPSINLYQLPVVLAIGPVIEEYLFRKVLYLYCTKYGIRRFVFLSALFFTLIHGYSVSMAAVVIFLGSFILAYFFLATLYSMYRIIYIPIQMHICWNFSIFMIGMFHVDTLAPVAFFTISLFVLLYAIYRIMKTKRLMIAEGPI